MNERVPFLATEAARRYDALNTLPVSILLNNVRSTYNVGSFFRTADAASVTALYLTGITARPPHKGIAKTALGAEKSVRWEPWPNPTAGLLGLRDREHEIALVETSVQAVDLFDWIPRFPVCLIFGHEVEGVHPELAAVADTHVRIPMLEKKHSLNVATAAGIVIYELLRKYRALGKPRSSFGLPES